MPNRLSRFSDGVMEACWLLAVILAPLFFNIYSSRVFEPDKIALVRSLALVAGAAWLVKLISEGGPRFTLPLPATRFGIVGSFARLPLVVPVAGLIIIYIVSTIFSVSPHASLLGSYQRMQGLFSTFSYIVLFAAIAANLRRREQVERLVTTVIFTSLPISIYGVLQRYERDPLPWGGDTVNRVTGNMGNAIFIAAYLIMSALLVLGRIVRAFHAILTDDDTKQMVPHVARATVYVSTFAVNLMSIYLSFSRGPWLGLFAGLYLFILLGLILLRQQAPDRSRLTAREILQALGFTFISLPVLAVPAYGLMAAFKRGWRWLWLSWVLTAFIGASVLVTLNIPKEQLESFRATSGGQNLGWAIDGLERLREIPGVNRLSQVFDEIEGRSGTGRVRVLIWSGVVKMMTPHDPIQYPDGTVDRWNSIRPLIGYGPEGLYVAYNPFYPPELAQLEARNATPDRSHNETFDALAFTGLIGLTIHFGLFVAIFYYSLKWLGLIGTPTRRIVFLVLVVGGGILGAGAFVYWQGASLFGVGLPFGMLLGLIVFLSLTALSPGAAPARPMELWRAITLISLFSAIVAHFTEIHFGIAIASTRTHFWIYTGLLLVLGYVFPAQAAPPAPAPANANPAEALDARARRRIQAATTRASSKQRPAPSWTPTFITALLSVALLATLGYDFITNPTRTTSTIDILSKSFTFLPQKNEASYWILWMILGTWVMASLVSYLEEARRLPDGPQAENLAVSWMVGLAGAGFTWLIISGQLAGIAQPMAQAATMDDLTQQVLRSAESVTNVLQWFYFIMFGLVVGLGFVLAADAPPLPARTNLNDHPVALGAYGLLPLIALGMAVFYNLQGIQADTIYKTGFQLDNEGRANLAEPIYRRAIELAPGEDYYYLFLGRALLNMTSVITDTTQLQASLTQAENELKVAQGLNPLNPDHTANLARLNRQWASLTADPIVRAERAKISSLYYERVLQISRNSALLWNEWALLNFQLLGDTALAQQQLDKSFSLDDKYDVTYQYQADLYLWQGDQDVDPTARAAFYQKAVETYQKGIEVSRNRGLNPTQMIVNLGNVYIKLQQFQAAIDTFQILITTNDPGVAQWRLYQQVAQLYLQLGDAGNARFNAEQAVNTAPEENRAEAQGFLDSIP